MEAKILAKKIDFAERVECLTKPPALITLKDQKEIFRVSLPYRLINPPKIELGKVSKVKLEKIKQAIIKHLDISQLKNSSAVIEWLKGTDIKKYCIFLKFDIREFCPSIAKYI